MTIAPKDVDEIKIQHAILELMKDGNIWDNAALKNKLKKTLPLSSHDKQTSVERPNEQIWENRVNNALSPSRGSSLYSHGHVENKGRGLHKITKKGLAFINGDLSDLYEFLGVEPPQK